MQIIIALVAVTYRFAVSGAEKAGFNSLRLLVLAFVNARLMSASIGVDFFHP